MRRQRHIISIFLLTFLNSFLNGQNPSQRKQTKAITYFVDAYNEQNYSKVANYFEFV
jgi:hypothetical protein